MEDNIKQVYYTTHQLSQELEVAPSKIRHWCEALGIVAYQPRRNVRKFTARQATQIRIAKQLTHMGLSLGIIRAAFHQDKPMEYLIRRIQLSFHLAV